MSGGAAGGAPVEASVIVVLTPGGGREGAPVEAAVRAAPAGSEVIVVANGSEALAGLDGTTLSGARVISSVAVLPFGAAANLGATAAVGRALCFVAPGATVTDGWLESLALAVGRGSVAFAVPLVVGPDGRVLEAGWAEGRNGTLAPLGGGGSPSGFEHRFPRRTGGGSRGCICVRRSAFVAAGGFDPSLADPAAAGAELCRSFRSAGLDCVYEPGSRVVVDRPAGLGAAVPLLREAEGDDRILALTSRVPVRSRTYGERRVAQLLSDLGGLLPEARLTLLAVEGHGARRSAQRFLGEGIEVVVGPEDWDDWFRRRSLLFSHILVTDIPSLRRLDGILRRTQPQAHRILCLPSLDHGNESVTPHRTAPRPDDAPAVELVVRHYRDELARAARAADAAWCATTEDREVLAAAVPGLNTTVVPTAAAPTDDVGFTRRSGYVVLAAPGSAVAAGHDDAALHAAREVFPSLLERDPAAFLRVVVDDPSPALQLLVGDSIELVPAGDNPARWFRRSRVCLALYPRGNGSREAIALAIDSRTPFVTYGTPGTDLPRSGMGTVHSLAKADDPLAASLRAGQLHGDRRLWDGFATDLARLAEGPRSAPAVRLALFRACADAGMAPRPGVLLAEPAQPRGTREPVLRPRNVPVVGSAWKAAPPAADEPLLHVAASVSHEDDGTEASVNEQYRRWCASYGPTRRRLARLADRLAGLVRQPVISIVMPVFNTDAAWLDDAISSVRSQVYENWELCIADDGSVEQGTLDVLERHVRDESRIHLTRLPGQQGISAASNAALALATGTFVGFLDHDDELKPHALGEIALLLDDQPDLDLVYTDEDKRELDGRLVDPFFKPDWSPDHLMSRNYVCHLLTLRRSLLEKLGGFRSGYDGSQDYDLVLRASELTSRIAHIPEPLYTWRKVEGSTAGDSDAKPWALDSARRALKDALARRGTPGEVLDGLHPTTYRVRYHLRGRPKVSILIPTRDRVDLLRNCIDSVVERSTYSNYEILVMDNESTDPDTLAYLATLPGRVVRFPHRFNYSRMMNLAAHEADGDMLLFLNNDTQVVSPEWLEALVEHGQRPEVGVVGPRLLYPSGRPQHEGTIVGHKGGHAGNVDHGGYWGLGDIVRNCSAVTGACLLMRPSVYWEMGGHDERLRIAYNDVDLCLRVRQAGYEIVYTPYAELFHVEGGTRGIHAHLDDDAFFEDRWVTHKCLDPYYSPNLERLYPFRIRT